MKAISDAPSGNCASNSSDGFTSTTVAEMSRRLTILQCAGPIIARPSPKGQKLRKRGPPWAGGLYEEWSSGHSDDGSSRIKSSRKWRRIRKSARSFKGTPPFIGKLQLKLGRYRRQRSSKVWLH